MGKVEIGTIAIAVIIFVYAIAFDKLILPKGINFYRGVIIASPGLLALVLLYAWLILGFTLLELTIYLVIGIVVIALEAIVIKVTADLLKKYLKRNNE